MGVKSLFLTNHTKESRLDLHLLTIALKADSNKPMHSEILYHTKYIALTEILLYS